MKQIILLYLLIFGQSVCAEDQTGTPQVFLPRSAIDFGQVLSGEAVKATFEIQNQGEAPLEISRIGTSCGCTTALLDQPVVAPGETARLQATFETTGRKGNQAKEISFHTNDPLAERVVLRLAGVVQPRVMLDPPLLFFKEGAENKGPINLYVKNEINPQFQILSVSASSEYLEVTTQTPQHFTLALKPGYPDDIIHEKVALFTNDPLQPIVWVAVWGRNH